MYLTFSNFLNCLMSKISHSIKEVTRMPLCLLFTLKSQITGSAYPQRIYTLVSWWRETSKPVVTPGQYSLKGLHAGHGNTDKASTLTWKLGRTFWRRRSWSVSVNMTMCSSWWDREMGCMAGRSSLRATLGWPAWLCHFPITCLLVIKLFSGKWRWHHMS